MQELKVRMKEIRDQYWKINSKKFFIVFVSF